MTTAPADTITAEKPPIKLEFHERVIVERFLHEVADQSRKVDVDGDYDWLALSVGFLMAHGIGPRRARTIGIHLRYDLEYGLKGASNA